MNIRFLMCTKTSKLNRLYHAEHCIYRKLDVCTSSGHRNWIHNHDKEGGYYYEYKKLRDLCLKSTA